MNLSHKLRKDVLIIKLDGSFDMTTVQQFNEYIFQNVKREKNIGIDFEEVSFCDSSAIGTMVDLLTRLRQKNRKLHIFALNDSVKETFNSTKMYSFFGVVSKKEFNRMFPTHDCVFRHA